MENAALEQLFEQIRYGSDVERKQALIRCAYGIGDAAVPGLLLLLQDKKADVRQAAVKALGMIANPLAVEHLRSIIAHEANVYTRGQAIIALAHCGGEVVIPDLINQLDNHERGRHSFDKRLSQYAAESLAKLATTDSLAAAEAWAINQLEREDYRDRVGGLLLLKRLGASRAIPNVRRLLLDHKLAPIYWYRKNDHYRVSDLAVETLRKIGGQEIVPEIEAWAIEQLNEDHTSVRYRAITLLLGYGRARCISPLLNVAALGVREANAVDNKPYQDLSKHALYAIEVVQKLKNVALTHEQEVLFAKYKALLNYQEVYS